MLANMMNLHLEMRRFVNVRIGDGEITNAWEDSWLSCGPLSTFTQYRFMYSCSFTRTTSVRHLLDTFHDGWPDDWTNCFPLLPSVALPFVDSVTTDVVGTLMLVGRRIFLYNVLTFRLLALSLLFHGPNQFGLRVIYLNIRFVFGLLFYGVIQLKIGLSNGKVNLRI